MVSRGSAQNRIQDHVKKMIEHQWAKVWLLQQDIEQIKASDFSSDVFTSQQREFAQKGPQKAHTR